jgi:hypothetical protein
MHMSIWRGRGILIAFIAFGCLLVTELLTRTCFHDNTYYQQNGWPKLVGFLIAGGLVWCLLPRRESDVSTPTGFQNPAATNSVLFSEQDQLFFVSVRYWPLILCALGVIFYFVRG